MAAPVLTANEAFQDAMIRHQVYLMRYSGAVRNQILKLLDESEEEIVSRIEKRLRNAEGGLGSPNELRRLEVLLEEIRRVRLEAWGRARDELMKEAAALAMAEPRMVARILATVSPVELSLALPDARVLKSIATSRPF